MTSSTQELVTLWRWFTKDSFVGIADVQKSPKKSLQWFKLIMNGSKPQGIYMDYQTREDFIEDFEMINSPAYQQKIVESRKWPIYSRDQVVKELWLDL